MKIHERFQEQYERLLEIRNQLDRLSVTQAWSLRETDLFGYQRKLDRIDEARVNGNFVDAEGQAADLHAQRVCICFSKGRSSGLVLTWCRPIDVAVFDSTQLCIHLCPPDLV